MLSEIAYRLPCGFETEARDRADHPGQHRTHFRPYVFEAVFHCFAGGFQSFGYCLNNSPDCDPGSKNDGC